MSYIKAYINIKACIKHEIIIELSQDISRRIYGHTDLAVRLGEISIEKVIYD